MVKEHGDNFDKMFNEAKWNEFFDFSWQEVFDNFKNVKISEKYELKWKEADESRIMKLLVDIHDFSEERVKSQIEALNKESSSKKQKGLGDFFN